MTIQVDNALPPNVVEIGNEITQGVVDGLMSASPSPSSSNPYATVNGISGVYLPLAGGTMTGDIGVNYNDLNQVTSIVFADNTIQTTASGAGAGVLLSSNNLSDLSNTSTARTNLGLGSVATLNTSAVLQTANNLSEVTPATARTNLGLAYATDAQSLLKTSTNSIITPDTLINSMVGWAIPTSLASLTATGNVLISSFGARVQLTATAAGQYAICNNINSNINTFTTSGNLYSDINYSKRIKLFAKMYLITPLASGLTCYFYFGRSNNSANVIGNLVNKGFGIRIVGGATQSPVELQVHDGTTLSNIASSFTPTNGITFDCLIDSLGNGTVNLYINGSLVATTSAGAIGTGGASFPLLTQEISSTASSSSGSFFVEGRSVYFA
jgi:hypothetical protein